MSTRVTIDPRTMVNAGIAVGIIACGLSTYAWFTLDDGVWTPPRTPQHFMSAGLQATGDRVLRELTRRHPPGTPMPRVLAWFQHEGFVCDPDLTEQGYLCLYRRSLAWNQQAELRVVLRAEGTRFVSASSRVDLRENAAAPR